MKKEPDQTVKKTLLYVIAGVAAVMVLQEVPAMVRYYKMKRL